MRTCLVLGACNFIILLLFIVKNLKMKREKQEVLKMRLGLN